MGGYSRPTLRFRALAQSTTYAETKRWQIVRFCIYIYSNTTKTHKTPPQSQNQGSMGVFPPDFMNFYFFLCIIWSLVIFLYNMLYLLHLIVIWSRVSVMFSLILLNINRIGTIFMVIYFTYQLSSIGIIGIQS